MLTIDNLSYDNINKLSLTILPSSSFIINNNKKQNSTNELQEISFLRIIAGLIKNYQGHILWENINILNFYQLYSSDINFLSKKSPLIEEFSVAKNLKLITSFIGEEILIDSAIRYFELENFLNRKINDLSDEVKQRILLLQLIYAPKTLWLLQNPERYLTEKWQEKLFNLMLTRIKEGGLIIMSNKEKIFMEFSKEINL